MAGSQKKLLNAAYFGLVHSHLYYVLSLWVSCSKQNFNSVLAAEKSCQNGPVISLCSMMLLTVYVSMSNFRYEIKRNVDIPRCGTRDSCRIQQIEVV